MAELWSDRRKLDTWLEVELTACEEMARLGLVPEEAARNLRRGQFEFGDDDVREVAEIESVSRHDVIAFLTHLAEHVGSEEARFVHQGMTSSDVLDTTLAVDVPGVSPGERITALGKGVAIKLTDSASISHPGLVNAMKKIAESRGIPYQMEILPRGGTDAGALQMSQEGAAAITLSLPSRYVHSVVETAHRDDIKAAIDLLAAFLEKAGSVDLTLP